MSAWFGVAGNSNSYLENVSKGSLKAPAWIAGMGLDCYEYQCGKGVRISDETAGAIGRAAKDAGIRMSLHAPYFINLANPDETSLQNNIRYVTESCHVAKILGATRIVVHTGALMKRTRDQAMAVARQSLKEILSVCDAMGYGDLSLCPETMGKINQLGDLDEVLSLCTLDERLIPCVDFGHLYARSLGALEGAEACKAMLDSMQNTLGEERARVFHSHFSHIEFTPNGGEKRHLIFADGQYGPDWEPLAREVARRRWSPTFICESAGTQAEDAQEMKKIYQALLSQGREA